MIFKILIRYILGYVNISIEGYYIERFVNVCISKGIFLWNLKIEKSSYAHANVGIKEVARKTNARIVLNSKRGMPFLMNRYRKRKMFAIFLGLIAGFILFQSRFVWNIQIDGLNRIQEKEILSDLSECGLNIGVRKSKINTKEIINKIR